MRAGQYVIGMMSGTSLDGVDAVLAYHDDVAGWQVDAHVEIALPAALKKTLYQLNFSQANELHVAKTAEFELTQCYAQAYQQLLTDTAVAPADILAIGAHGQTIRHEPNLPLPYTIQLLNGALLSQLTQQTVVCDFRSKDIAAGGQGAPFAPLFHQALFPCKPPFAVVNIGGISNVSLMNNDGVSGFDCGPGNCLLDEWILQHCQQAFDKDGAWAAQGRLIPELLARLKSDTYFAKQPPKSTGRDYFNHAWLAEYLLPEYRSVDVMRTLVRLTAEAIVDNVCAEMKTLVLVGGGAKNPLLVADVRDLLAMRHSASAVLVGGDLGIDVQQVEALGFAVLAAQTMQRKKAETPAITGATEGVLLGAVHYYE